METVLQYALAYAKRGWHIIPTWWPATTRACACPLGPTCPSIGKHPLTRHGHKDATTKTEQIQTWFNKWPQANIAIATGKISAIFVIDVDSAQGQTTLAELDLPLGPTIATGRPNGMHYYYEIPPDLTITSGPLTEGLDIKSEGGLATTVPSLHQNGTRYHAIDHNMAPAKPPPQLLELCVKTGRAKHNPSTQQNTIITNHPTTKPATNTAYGQAALTNETQNVATANEGQRNHILNQAAFNLGQLVAAGQLQTHVVLEALTQAGQTNGLAETEIQKTLQSGLTAGLKCPRNIPTLNGTNPQDTSRFQRLTKTQLKNIAPPGWLVQNHFPQRSLIGIYAPTASYKTFAVLQLAFCIPAGIDWHHNPVKKGPVVYIAGEDWDNLVPRLEALEQHYEIQTPSDLTIICEPPQLGSIADLEELLTELKKSPSPELIILDPIAPFMIGTKENDASEWGLIIAGLKRIQKEIGTAVLLTHHTGLNPVRERGSTSVRAAFNTWVRITVKDEQVTLECEKQKNAPKFDPVILKPEQTRNSVTLCEVRDFFATIGGSKSWSWTKTNSDGISQPNQLQLKQLNQFEPHGATNYQWYQATNEAESTFNYRLKQLINEGYVTKSDGQYHLTPKGKQTLK